MGNKKITVTEARISSRLLAAKGAWAIVLVAAIAIGSRPAAAQTCPAARDRAMWINRPGSHSLAPDVVGDPTQTEQDALFDFSTRFDIGISDFFLSVPVVCRTSPEDPLGWTCTVGGEGATGRTYRSQLRGLIRRAHNPAINIRAHSLFGDGTMALRNNHNRVRRQIRAILEFNDAGEIDEKFDGIHLDVEPHSLPEFKDAMRGLPCLSPPSCPVRWDIVRDILGQFLDMNEAVVEELALQNLNLGVDVPDSWYPSCRDGSQPGCPQEQVDDHRDFMLVWHEGEEPNYPTYHLMNIVKDVTIMSYHRNPNTMIRKTEYAMAYADRPDVGARLNVGVQTAPPCDLDPMDPTQCSALAPVDSRPPVQTMGHLSRPEMEQQLCSIDSYFTGLGLNSFRGFSYFKYFTYANMRE